MGLCASSNAGEPPPPKPDAPPNSSRGRHNHSSQPRPQSSPSNSRAHSFQVDKEASRYSDVERRNKKILFLGAGDSGKSTMIKQMKVLYQGGYSEAEARLYKEPIYLNIIESVQIVSRGCAQLRIAFSDDNMYRAEAICQLELQYRTLKEFGDLNENLLILLQDPAFPEAAKRRHQIPHPDNTFYWLTEAPRVLNKGDKYIPTPEDILRCKLPTLGVVTSHLAFSDTKFEIYDMGGHRGQRKKWIHYFDHVDLIVFVASLNEFDQVLQEDQEINRMTDSLMLFEHLVNLPFFNNTEFVLIFNKEDLFKEKVKHLDLSLYFPDFPEGVGNTDATLALNWIREAYLSRVKKQRKIKTFVSNATNTKNFQIIWENVRKTFTQRDMRLHHQMISPDDIDLNNSSFGDSRM